MKPNDMDIDEILKRHLPRPTSEEADAAGERVLQRIRALRFSDPGEAPKAVPLTNELGLAILTAVDELQGRGHPATITLKAAELLEEMVSGSWVPVILRMMERMELVTSSPDPNEPDALDKRTFQITASGRETVAVARAAAARRAAGPLADFA